MFSVSRRFWGQGAVVIGMVGESVKGCKKTYSPFFCCMYIAIVKYA